MTDLELRGNKEVASQVSALKNRAFSKVSSAAWSCNEIGNLKARTMSAMTKTAMPIKLTFNNVNYTVRVANSKE